MNFRETCSIHLLDSIVVSIPACHAGDRGSIPRLEGIFFCLFLFNIGILTMFTALNNF